MAYGIVNVPGVTSADLEQILREAVRYTDEHTEMDVSAAYAKWETSHPGDAIVEYAKTLQPGNYRIDDGGYSYRIRYITNSGYQFIRIEEYTDEGFYYETLYRDGKVIVKLSAEPNEEGLFINGVGLATKKYVDEQISDAISAAY